MYHFWGSTLDLWSSLLMLGSRNGFRFPLLNRKLLRGKDMGSTLLAIKWVLDIRSNRERDIL